MVKLPAISEQVTKPEKSLNQKNITMRPHHAEGAMRIIGNVLRKWDSVGDGAEKDPMVIMEMFFDAVNYVKSTTISAIKNQIEKKWTGNEGFQKMLDHLAERYKDLRRDFSPEDSDQYLINSGQTEMYQGLKEAHDRDPRATVTFINGYDFVCDRCIHEKEGIPPCLVMGAIPHKEQPEMIIDDKVREAHGWKYNKPYEIGDILAQFFREAIHRKIFLVLYDQGTDENYLRGWSYDVAQSKK